MDPKRHVVTIVIDDIDKAFQPVSELLHAYAPHILLRVGFPCGIGGIGNIPGNGTGYGTNGCLFGKLGMMQGVKVKPLL
jgi:hypothetical protein